MSETNLVTEAAEVVDTCTAKKVDGVLLDLQTAQLIVKLNRALSPPSREKLTRFPIRRAGELWKLVK